ncbi:serine/threonine-protein phosphatase [Galactobacter valiniphilus]|uniref:Serine/threonine-protein phosphatase n=1 Tax=Galactobacter valiniphilus TaxID=2676122 RepID=A0A399J9R7_9MICC|nr:PP2C family serine/threonine-protein phosphatase [Galactobacter valiniphilus]RII42323.1 serine/threonine-protein phosphatase [Galactobacter valiniphilus]
MALYLDFAAASDVGRVRKKNDDSGYAGRYLAVVADGMGGHVGGDVASASTVLDLVHLDHPDVAHPATTLADEIQSANIILNELVDANPKLSGMGTTVTALLLTGDRFRFAHIGDSRAYRLKDGVWEQISRDHTFVEKLLEEGRITPEEAKVHPHRNVIMRVLGDSDASPELDLQEFPVEPGEVWMLCSDGINAVVPEEETERIVRLSGSVEDAANALVQRTLELGSPDNVTAVVVQVLDDAATPPSLPRTPAEAADDPSPDTGQLRVAADGDLAANQAILRHEMANRPHSLVGAALLATESGQIPIVTQRSGERRAAALLNHKSAQAEADALAPEAELLTDEPRRRRGWVLPGILVVCIGLLASVLYFGYTWTQTRYFAGLDNGKVAVFQGVSQDIGPLKLSHVDTTTQVPVDVLPKFWQDKLSAGIPAENRQEAMDTLRLIVLKAKEQCTVVAPGAGGSVSSEAPAFCTEEVPQ